MAIPYAQDNRTTIPTKLWMVVQIGWGRQNRADFWQL